MCGVGLRQPGTLRHSKTTTGFKVVGLEFCEVRQQLLLVGPALQIEADHLVGPQGRLAAGPQGQQQARDDRTVGLDLDARPGRAQ